MIDDEELLTVASRINSVELAVDLIDNGWRFIFTEAARGCCDFADRRVLLPRWCGDPAPLAHARALHTIWHESIHAVVGQDDNNSHGDIFQDALKSLMPQELHRFEDEYRASDPAYHGPMPPQPSPLEQARRAAAGALAAERRRVVELAVPVKHITESSQINLKVAIQISAVDHALARLARADDANDTAERFSRAAGSLAKSNRKAAELLIEESITQFRRVVALLDPGAGAVAAPHHPDEHQRAVGISPASCVAPRTMQVA
jgi:hypothetical protein